MSTQLELRDYQEKALEAVAVAEARGVRRQLIVAATGLGKTIMFCALAQRRGGRTLILAHRDELVTQAANKVREVWPGVDVGIVKAARDETSAQVVVASVQTLAREKRLDSLCRPFDGSSLLLNSDPFDLVIIDEAHHAAADSYRNILDRLRAGRPYEMCDACRTADENGTREFDVDCEEPLRAGPLLIGVTATPDRGDGKGLDDLFDEIVSSNDILWGIGAGYLSDLRGVRVTVDGLFKDGLRTRQGDYDQGQAGRLMEEADAEKWIVKAWKTHAADRRTIVFTPTVELARIVSEEFASNGVPAAYVHGGTPLDERRTMLADFSAGRLQVIVNCAVLTEGYDEPRVDCIVMARPTKSRALYTQCVGRGTRRHPDKANCLVLDVVGASTELSLITVPSLFGLPKKFAERLGDGTGELSEVVREHADELVRLGKIRAEEAELFHQIRGDGIAWVGIHAPGDAMKRYMRPMGGADDPKVILAQRDATLWTSGVQYPDGSKRVLLANVPMELAQGAAEDFIRKNIEGSTALINADAAWRKKKPSDKQLAAAAKWRLEVDPAWKAGDLSDALTAHIERIKSRNKPKMEETV